MITESDYRVLLETMITTARKAMEASRDGADEHSKALALAYGDVLDAVITEANILGVPLKDIGLDG